MMKIISSSDHFYFEDGLLLFRSLSDSVSDASKPLCPVPGESLVEDGLVVEADSISDSPIRSKKDLSPSLTTTLSPDTPQTSSVPTTLTPNQPKRDQRYPTDREKGGWEAQIMQLRNGTAEKIASFRGGGSDEDALCLAPGSGKHDSDIIAMDLAHKPGGEILLCCLTKSVLSVYGIPELARSNANELSADANTVTLTSGASTVARVYKNKESASWWNQSEEDVFGDVPMSRTMSRVEDETSLHASALGLERGLTPFDMETSLPIVENITNLIAAEKSPTISRDGGDGMTVPTAVNEVETGFVVDLNKAKRCPCPPLCGVAFGKAGTLVAFNNGPVKKMWSWYRNSPTGLKLTHSNTERIVYKNNEVTPSTLDSAKTNEQKTADEDHSKSDTPRTLFDVIEMTSSGMSNWFFHFIINFVRKMQSFSFALICSKNCSVGNGA
jgi:hypothetical protein